MQKVEVLHNGHPKRNIGSAKRGGGPSEAKSCKPINVVQMSSTFAPSLTAAIIFRRTGSHDRYRKTGLQTSFANGREKKNWSRFRVVLTKETQGGNINASRQQSDYSTYSSYQEMKGCRRKCKLIIQIHYTKSETRCNKKIKLEQSHCAWFSGFPLQQIWPGLLKSAER